MQKKKLNTDLHIDINLYGQVSGKYRIHFLILGIVGIVGVGVAFMMFETPRTSAYLSWIAMLPGLLHALICGAGQYKTVADKLPYLRINRERIEMKPGLFTKPTHYAWSDIKTIDVRLFEIVLTTTDDKTGRIDLSLLTDHNLKRVKDLLLPLVKGKTPAVAA